MSKHAEQYGKPTVGVCSAGVSGPAASVLIERQNGGNEMLVNIRRYYGRITSTLYAWTDRYEDLGDVPEDDWIEVVW